MSIDIDVYVCHIRDGFCKYNKDQFSFAEESLCDNIKSFLKTGVGVYTGDVLPSNNKDHEDDTYFYFVKHRQFGINPDDNKPFVIFYVDDLDNGEFFDDCEE